MIEFENKFIEFDDKFIDWYEVPLFELYNDVQQEIKVLEITKLGRGMSYKGYEIKQITGEVENSDNFFELFEHSSSPIVNYHEYISETKTPVPFSTFFTGKSNIFAFKIVKGGNYHIKIKLHIRMISGADVRFKFQYGVMFNSEALELLNKAAANLREIQFTDKDDDGKYIRTFEDTIKDEYEKDKILCIFPVTGGQASNFTIEKGSYIRFSYSR